MLILKHSGAKMIEIVATIGISAIIVLQVANLWQGKRTSQKVDNMVTNDRCLERMDNCKRELHVIERKMDSHVHNGGGGVKYKPVDLRE